MKPALQPCGTPAAYMRHKRREEDACEACKAAWSQRYGRVRESVIGNRKQSPMDRLLDERPPQITWQRRAGGVYVAVKVIDPHAETSQSPLRARRQAEHYAQKKAPECMNESLLAAARTEL